MTQQEKRLDLKMKLSEFMTKLDALNPEDTSIEDIDRLLSMLNELEHKLN